MDLARDEIERAGSDWWIEELQNLLRRRSGPNVSRQYPFHDFGYYYLADYDKIFSLRSDGQKQKHEVKPLEFFWASFPQW